MFYVGYRRRMDNTPPRYALYTRISKDPTGESTSPARQEKECRALASERGIEIVDVFTDVDLSAYRTATRRPAYESMLEAMESGAVDGVLIWKLDRLVRRITEFSRFWKVATDHDIALVSKSDPIDTTSPMGLAFVYVLVGIAEQESNNTSTRLLSMERHLAETGVHKARTRKVYGLAPGWDAIDQAEAAVVTEAAGRILAGEPVGSIAADLNQRGIPAPRGGEWTRRSLSVVMTSARLFAKREHHGEITADGTWPAILDEATGMRLRTVLAPGQRARPTPRRGSFLLSGLMRCGKCGATMRVTGSAGARKYSCPPKTGGGCNGTTIQKDPAETAIAGMVRDALKSPDLAATIRARRNAESSAASDAELLAELVDLERQERELAEMWADRDLSRSAWKAGSKALDERRDIIGRELAAVKRSAPLEAVLAATGGLDGVWESWDTGRRRATLETVLDHVVVHGNGSEWYRAKLAEALQAEADEARSAGDEALAKRRERQAASRTGGGGSFRPERLQPIWRV